jgi:hypothetical protein
LNENQGPMKTKSINAGNCSEKRKPIRLLKWMRWTTDARHKNTEGISRQHRKKPRLSLLPPTRRVLAVEHRTESDYEILPAPGIRQSSTTHRRNVMCQSWVKSTSEWSCENFRYLWNLRI